MNEATLKNAGQHRVAAATESSPPVRVGLVALGCKVNQYELDALGTELRRRGYVCVEAGEPADAYCVNTCAVTATSEKKSRQLIRRLHHQNPQAVIVVMGCYSQRAAATVASLPGVRLVIGTAGRARIPDWLDRQMAARVSTAGHAPGYGYAGGMRDGDGNRDGRSCPAETKVHPVYRLREYEELPTAFTRHTRAVVKIQDGCSLFCSYCIIPHLRGPGRSRPPEAVREEVRQLVAAGYQEIVLTGVHLAGYGEDLPGEWTLARLVREVGKVPGLTRLRLSSLHPNEVTDDLLQVLEETPAFCPHFHLPVQSGDDGILKRMRRSYRADQVRRLAERLRRIWPEVALTTDIITGFPGETEAAFARTVSLCQDVGWSRLHVFPFSPREGTPAARYPDQVEKAVREERARELIRLGRELAESYHRRFVGRQVEVLIEEEDPAGRALIGLTRTYVRVRVRPGEPGRPDAPGGSEERLRPQVRSLIQVDVTGADAGGLEAVCGSA